MITGLKSYVTYRIEPKQIYAAHWPFVLVFIFCKKEPAQIYGVLASVPIELGSLPRIYGRYQCVW